MPETTSLRQSTSTGPVQTGVQHQQTSSSPPPPQPQPAGPAEDQEKASMQTVAPNPHVSGSTEKTATVEQQRRDSQDQKAADGSAQVSAIMTKGQARKGPGDLPSTQKHATARVHKEKETKNATEEPKRGAQGQMTRQQQQQHPQPPGKPRLIFPKSMSSLLRAKPNAGVGPVDKTKAAVTPTQRDERQHHPEEEKKDRTDTDTSTSSRPKLLPKKRRLRRRRFIDDEAEVDEEGDVPSADEVEDTAEDLLMDGFIVDDNDEVTYSSSQEEQCGDPAVPAENERGTYRSLDNLHESAAEKQPTLARGPNPAKKARTSPRDIPGHVRIAIGPAPSPSSANARAHGRKKTGPPPEMIDLERPRRISVEHLMDMIKSPDRLWPAYKILCQAVRRDMSSILKDNCGEECFKLSDPELLEAIRVLLALAESVLLPRSLALKHAQMENESDRDPTLHGRYISEQVSAVQKFDEQFKQENMLQSDAVFGPEQVEALRENFKGRPGSVYPFARLFSRLNTLRSYAFCEVEMEEEDDDDNEHKRTEPHRCSVTGRTISPGDRVYLLQVYSYCDEATRARGEDRACFYISRHHGYPHLYIGQVCVYITYRWQRSKFIKRILDWSEKVMKFGPSATGLDRLAAFLRHKNVTHVAAILEEYLAFKWLFNVYVNRGPQANDGAPTSSGGKDNGGDGKIDAQSATAKEVPGKRRRVSAPLRVGQQNAQVILNRF